jgi:hypothetical protein
MSETKTRRVRITHDGSVSSHNVKVVDAETGELIRYVSRVEFVADANTRELTAVIFIYAPEIDVTVDAEVRAETV